MTRGRVGGGGEERRPISAFLAGRCYEAFLAGASFAEVGRRFGVAKARVEAVVRRAGLRARRRR